MGSNHGWKTPQQPVSIELVLEASKVVIDNINTSSTNIWKASIADVIAGTGRPASQIDDWYGTFLSALDTAQAKQYLEFKSAGPKGRWYSADSTMQANFLAAVAAHTGNQPHGSFSTITTVTISCPHCSKPHNYTVNVSITQ